MPSDDVIFTVGRAREDMEKEGKKSVFVSERTDGQQWIYTFIFHTHGAVNAGSPSVESEA